MYLKKTENYILDYLKSQYKKDDLNKIQKSGMLIQKSPEGINSDFGTIAYGSGLIQLGALTITESRDLDHIVFSVLPSGSDITAINEQLLLIEEEDITISLVKDV